MEEKNIQTKEDFHPAGKPIQQLLNLVPKEKRKQAELLAVKIEQHSVYSGPLPPAEQFAAYESILPGSAERILQMAEKQQSHRMQLVPDWARPK